MIFLYHFYPLFDEIVTWQSTW